MVKSWIIYLLALLGAVFCYLFTQQWLGWFVLLFVVVIPFFSLLVSLPAIITARIGVRCTPVVTLGEQIVPALTSEGPLPIPPLRGKLQISCALSGEKWRIKPGKPLPAAHCGAYVCDPARIRIFDYLGLFGFHVSGRRSATVYVRPAPLATRLPNAVERYAARSWHPKPGGGFSENYDLRLYRPGDSLNQVHWKLSAKTGKLVIREAMIPRQGTVVMTVSLWGTAAELDRKFGRLLWTGSRLLEQSVHFQLRAFTGNGALSLRVNNQQELLSALDTLLSQTPARQEAEAVSSTGSTWYLHIGGDADES